MSLVTPTLGRYELCERLARGGMGEVFRAVAIGANGFEKPVVVKRILPKLAGDDRLTELFASEAKLMTHLVHPNIVQVLDFGRGTEGEYFLVLELVEGLDLERFRRSFQKRGEDVGFGLAFHVVGQVLRGLRFAHEHTEHPLVHRDVSPSNVLCSRQGEVKLADFGVALARGRPGAEFLAGKAGYTAPEQLVAGVVDPRADLFAAGAVLFELLTHELPFAAPGELRRCSELRARTPSELDAFFARALALAPGERFASAREMTHALLELQRAAPPLVDGEALAEEVVRALADEERTAVPVVSLGLPDARVLTRVTVPNVGSVFELGKVAPIDPIRAPRRQRALAIPLLIVVAIAIVLGVLGTRGFFTRQSTEQSSDATASASTVVPPISPSTPPKEQPSSVRVSPMPSASRVPAPRARGTGPEPRPEPSDPNCRGSVHLYSQGGSWTVEGGPTTVQAPGRYEWPCGTYQLSATSRMDPSRRVALSVRVRDGATSAHELR